MTRSKLYTSRLDICLTEEHKMMLMKLAKDSHKTISEVIRELILDRIKDNPIPIDAKEIKEEDYISLQ